MRAILLLATLGVVIWIVWPSAPPAPQMTFGEYVKRQCQTAANPKECYDKRLLEKALQRVTDKQPKG